MQGTLSPMRSPEESAELPWQQAMFCLHWLLMRSEIPMMTVCVRLESALKQEELTIEVELGALVEETETLGTVLASEKVGEGTS